MISYVDALSSDLKLAKWTGSAWSIEVVDSGTVAPLSSLAIDNSGLSMISYVDALSSDLKLAKWTGSAWSIEVVDSGYSSP